MISFIFDKKKLYKVDKKNMDKKLVLGLIEKRAGWHICGPYKMDERPTGKNFWISVLIFWGVFLHQASGR